MHPASPDTPEATQTTPLTPSPPLDQVEKAEAAREWTWNNPALLHEEFISVNERHRRESQTNPIAVF
tara:strand:- start:358 stop:558 length:201 start_codon:yes stop_codon:yes gene_type:complete